MRIRVVALTVTLAVAAGACDGGTDHEATRRVAGLPTSPGALQGPGAAIGDGFSVTKGSWLIGDTFPGFQYAFRGEPVEGWDAVLFLDDQPLRRLQSYFDQAEAAGYVDFSFLSFYGRQPCGTELDGPPAGPAPPDDGISRQGELLTCSVAARRPAAGDHFDSVFFALYVGRPFDCTERCQQSYASYLEIATTYDDPGNFVGTDPRPTAPEVASLPVPKLPVPPKDLRLPSAGERVGADQTFFEGFLVEPGSDVVAPGAGLNTGGTGAFSVMLRITGEPESVVEAYLTQFQRVCCPDTGPDSPSNVTRQRVAGSEQLYAFAGQSGGLSISIVTTPLGEDRPVFARVDVSND